VAAAAEACAEKEESRRKVPNRSLPSRWLFSPKFSQEEQHTLRVELKAVTAELAAANQLHVRSVLEANEESALMRAQAEAT
jgi:hypothetical protein